VQKPAAKEQPKVSASKSKKKTATKVTEAKPAEPQQQEQPNLRSRSKSLEKPMQPSSAPKKLPESDSAALTPLTDMDLTSEIDRLLQEATSTSLF